MRSKPANMKYTDLCIYIDKTLYERDENNNPIKRRELTAEEIDNVYTYLYHITYALAVKKRLFTNQKDYQSFSLDSAGRFLMRFISPNQVEGTSRVGNCRPFVKSVLNYIKGAIGFMAVTFRQDNYDQRLNPEYNSMEEIEGARAWVENEVNAQFNSQIISEVVDAFKLLPTYLREVSDTTLYKNNEVKRYNFEMSILLSLLNALTLEGKLSAKTDRRKYFLKLKQLENRENYSLAWRDNLDITPQIIEFYTRKLFKVLESDIDSIKSSYVLDQNVMDEILKSSLPTYGLDQSED